MTKTQKALPSGEGAEAPPAASAPSKIASVITMLGTGQGATLEELVSATGWQPHTARAVLSGLKKKGHTVEREKRDGVSHYRVTQAAHQ